MMKSIPLIVRENKAFIFCILLAMNLLIVLRTANNKVFIHLESITANSVEETKQFHCAMNENMSLHLLQIIYFFFFAFQNVFEMMRLRSYLTYLTK